MLSKDQRLAREQFTQVARRGFSIQGTCLSLKISPLPEQTRSQFAIVVSKRVIRTASGRHLFKRRLYSILSAHLKSAVSQPAWGGIFYAKSGADRLTYTKLAEEAKAMLKRTLRV